MEFEELKSGLWVCRSKVHSFGTDAFLLTAFSHYKAKDTAVEFGTGCGIIPLLMQKKRPPKRPLSRWTMRPWRARRAA